MQRREILRTAGIAVALAAMPAAGRGTATADALADRGAALWRRFVVTSPKRVLLPEVRAHVAVILGAVRDGGRSPRLLGALSEALQLAGEIFLDLRRYGDAAHAHDLAATAARDAGHADRHACALARRAYVALYEHRPADADALLASAGAAARDGDGALPTRHWVAAVAARARAALGDADGCARALAAAAGAPPAPPLGWLRFDGGRLAEERGACAVLLGQPGRAIATLDAVLDRPLSARRRGGVLADLVIAAAQQRDVDRIERYGDAAVDLAAAHDSGVVAQRLADVRVALAPLRRDRRVRALDDNLATLIPGTT
ncbi:transcriptional regulator [Pilimelia anulata]|uniref:transcriptional regulator n=1 Tax=Pilimelia anulata TaxID=53371 RepID=UPI00166E55E8|nr:transcriptional regulator [Pilimelia anulata]